MISLLMLTYHRPGGSSKGVLARSLRSLLPVLQMPEVECLIIDQASTDGTGEWLLKVAARYPAVRPILFAHNLGVAGGRAALLDLAQGDTLIFLDNDVVALNGVQWLDLLLAPLTDPKVALAGPGGHWVKPDWSWYDPVEEDYAGRVDTVSGFCQALRREALDGFEMDLTFNPYWHEDTDTALWLQARGYAVWCTGDIGLHHIFSGTGADDTGKAKQDYLASKWRGQGLIRAERYASSDE